MVGVIVSLDPVSWGDLDEVRSVVSRLCRAVDGFKPGWPLIVAHGVSALGEVRRACRDALWLLDLKLADVGYVMSSVASRLAPYYDALIAHAFPGYEGAVEELAGELRRLGRRLVLVVSMSNPGAARTFDPELLVLLDVAVEADAWGVVVPATRPRIVRLARAYLGESKVILSPGVGAQGAEPGSAVCAGADYEIVGRLVLHSPDPLEVVKRIYEAQRRCGGG